MIRSQQVEFKLDIPYMTGPERAAFKARKESIFRSAECECQECEELVPKDVKRFCSIGCYRKEEGSDDGGEEEQEEEASWPVA